MYRGTWELGDYLRDPLRGKANERVAHQATARQDVHAVPLPLLFSRERTTARACPRRSDPSFWALAMVCPDKLSGRRVPLPSSAMPRRAEPDPLALAVGQRIRALREERGLTQEKLAYESDVKSKGHLSSIEAGLVMPTIATLKVIADGLDVLVADLVSGPGDGDRGKILELTRGLPAGVLRRLVKELSAAKPKKPKT